jgi:hypothetical protein
LKTILNEVVKEKIANQGNENLPDLKDINKISNEELEENLTKSSNDMKEKLVHQVKDTIVGQVGENLSKQGSKVINETKKIVGDFVIDSISDKVPKSDDIQKVHVNDEMKKTIEHIDSIGTKMKINEALKLGRINEYEEFLIQF